MTVLCTVNGNVARVTLDRPERRNAFDGAMAEDLDRVLARLAGAGDCSVVTIEGAGDHFCAGWDIAEFAALRELPTAERAAVLAGHSAVLDRLGALPQVTVALVRGAAMGFGVSLVARCDAAVGGATARFAFPEARVGIVPALVLADLAALAPPKQVLDILLTGRSLDAPAAVALGLLSRVAAGDPGEDDLVAELARVPVAVARATKALYRRLGAADGAAKPAIAAGAAADTLGSPYAGEGIAAFLEKRTPVWPEP